MAITKRRNSDDDISFKEPLAPARSSGLQELKRGVKKVVNTFLLPPPHMGAFTMPPSNKGDAKC
jgi:hypothetical protein